MSEKPHKGTIANWHKASCDGGLGYMIIGRSAGHYDVGDTHTSYVVAHEGNEIETRNSRYTLAPDPNVAPPGKIWTCGSCGLTAQHRYGNYAGYKASPAWDDSCALNSVLIAAAEEEDA